VTDAPIPLVLQLWSIGHSASQIAEMVGLPSHKAVTRIIAQAREIGDPRAILHCGANGRLLGRPGRTGRKASKYGHKVAGKEVVTLLPKPTIPVCRRGHERTERGECKTCKRMTDRLRYRAMRGLP
jgi:hypothetical protein